MNKEELLLWSKAVSADIGRLIKLSAVYSWIPLSYCKDIEGRWYMRGQENKFIQIAVDRVHPKVLTADMLRKINE